MKHIILFNLLAVLAHHAFPQTMVGGNPAKGLDMNTAPYGIVSAFGSAEKTTTGSSYLYEDWKTGTIQFPQGEIKNAPLKIDFKNNQIEINTDKGIRTIAASRVSKVLIGYEGIDQKIFEHSKNYNGTEAEINGLVEVLVKNNTTLLKYYYSYTKEAAYNAQLDMGNNETRTLVKNRYFLYKDSTLKEVKGNRKSFIRKFPKNTQGEIEKFMNEKGINLKQQDDLIAVCKFLNENNIVY